MTEARRPAVRRTRELKVFMLLEKMREDVTEDDTKRWLREVCAAKILRSDLVDWQDKVNFYKSIHHAPAMRIYMLRHSVRLHCSLIFPRAPASHATTGVMGIHRASSSL